MHQFSQTLVNCKIYPSELLSVPDQRSIVSKHKTEIAKGQLQRQNKLIPSKMPFEILQNETEIVENSQAVLEIFNLKDLELDSFPRKND